MNTKRSSASASTGSMARISAERTELVSGQRYLGGAEGAQRAVTWRALLIAFLLTPVNCLWIVHTEIVRYAGHPTTTSLYFNVIFCLMVLTLVNRFVRLVRPRWALWQGELMVIYTTLSLASCMVGHDMYQVLIACLVHPFWFASPENGWESLFFAYLPKWLMVSDKDVLRGYMLGGDTFYKLQYLQTWTMPLLIWTGFFIVLLIAMLCLNVVFRRRWTEQERLTYPIVFIPVEMTKPGLTLFKEKLFWSGFWASATIDIINNLNANFPSVPILNVRTIFLNTYITTPPWNAIGWTPLAFFPFIIGLTYFLPLDLSFSCVFFYWFWKMQMVANAYFGWGANRPFMPYINEQSCGAYLGVCFFVVWIGRKYLYEVVRRAIGLASRESDAEEPFSYRVALITFVFCYVCAAIFFWKAGMTFGIALVFFVIYFALSVAVTRMRAELGSPAHDLHYAGPEQIITRAMGSKNLPKPTLAAFSLCWGFNRAYRCHPMPHQLEGFKIAQQIGFAYQPLAWAMLLLGLWGSFCAFWAHLHVYYQLGASTAKIVGPSVWFGWEPYNRLASWLRAPTQQDPTGTAFMVGGFLFTCFLMEMRSRLMWWPFHPVGLAVSSSWAMNWMWFAVFCGWATKSAILHIGGLSPYRKGIPFFIGLVLGEYTVGSICNILGLIRGWKIYRFWG